MSVLSRSPEQMWWIFSRHIKPGRFLEYPPWLGPVISIWETMDSPYRTVGFPADPYIDSGEPKPGTRKCHRSWISNRMRQRPIYPGGWSLYVVVYWLKGHDDYRGFWSLLTWESGRINGVYHIIPHYSKPQKVQTYNNNNTKNNTGKLLFSTFLFFWGEQWHDARKLPPVIHLWDPQLWRVKMMLKCVEYVLSQCI